MPERLEDIEVTELSLVPKGAHPGTDFVPLAKGVDATESDDDTDSEDEDSEEDDSLDKNDKPREPVAPADLAKEFVRRLGEMDSESLNTVADAILAKAAEGDDSEDGDGDDVDDPLAKRMDAMEKALDGVTGGLMKSAESIEKLIEILQKEDEPEPVPEPAAVDPALAKCLEKVAQSVASFEAQFRSTQAKALVALGEDPGDSA